MKLLVVYNPHAGHGSAARRLPAVENELHRHGLQYDLRQTTGPGSATEIVATADLAAYDGVVAAGGDGTLFEVVNGLFANPGRRPPLGVLPIGTGNAFARDLQLAGTQWRQAVAVIAAHTPRRVDVARFQTNGQTYYYLNILGLGFVADVNRTALRLKAIGNAAYTVGVLLEALRLRPMTMHLEIDGHTLSREGMFVEISNTRYTANFLIAPGARIDDGLLDVILVNRMPRTRLLRAFPLVFRGEHVRLPEVEVLQARSIHIETATPKALSPDGEIVGSTPVQIECLPGAIEVFGR